MVSAKLLCCNITCESIPGSSPPFLFFVGARGEPRNEDTQIIAELVYKADNGHPAIALRFFAFYNFSCDQKLCITASVCASLLSLASHTLHRTEEGSGHVATIKLLPQQKLDVTITSQRA